MLRVIRRVDEREARFAEQPFFARLRAEAPWSEVAPVVPALAFWVLTFHDLLELAEPRMRDPELRRIVRHHRAEETGHDVWYLQDLERLGVPLPDPVALFGPAHAGTRRAAYRLVSEVLRSEADETRIALVLMMEATGRVFFQHASRYPHFPANGLQFFSGHHLIVEQAHELFERKMRAFLEAMTLDEAVVAEALGAVDRGFDAFDAMFEPLSEVPRRGEAAEVRPVAAAAGLLGG